VVDVYSSDEEKAEALKQWWRQNGKSVAGGVVIGLAGVFGWQSWSQHQENQRAEASFQYHLLTQVAEVGSDEALLRQQQQLEENYGRSIYALFATLEMARVRVEADDLEGAAALLERVMSTTKDPSLQQIARLRLARIWLAQEKIDAADALLNAAPRDAFQGEIDALQGDIALRRNHLDEARAAYRAALVNGAGNRNLLQLRLESLGEG